MKDNITKEITTIYAKIDTDTSNKLKEYNKSINSLEKKSRRFWAIEGIKEAFFWSMCFGMILFISKELLILWGQEEITEIWKVLYMFSLAPLIKYWIVKIIDIICEK